MSPLRPWRRGIGACLLGALASLGGACSNDLPQATEIAHTRPLGAQASVIGDPTRATPAPGEKATLQWDVVFPDSGATVADLRSLFISCTFPDRFVGIPLCQEVTDAAQQGVSIGDVAPDLQPLSCDEDDTVRFGPLALTCVTGAPRMQLNVPAAFTAPALLVRGVICERGVPFIDPNLPELFGCDDGPGEPGETMLVYGSVQVEQSPEGRNHNPSFDDVELQLNGQAWEALDEASLPADDACAEGAADSGLPLIDPFKHRFGVRVDPDVREEVGGVPEDMEFSFFASDGELDERFIVFEGEDPVEEGDALEDAIVWHGPGREDLSPAGQLARVFVSLLDRRGGYDLAARYVCLYDCLDGTANVTDGCR